MKAVVTFEVVHLLGITYGVHRPVIPACSISRTVATAGMTQLKVCYKSAQISYVN